MVSIPDYVGLGIGNHQLDANAALQRDDSIPVPMDDRDLGPGCPQIHQVPVHQPHPSAYHVVHRMPGRVVGVPCQVYDRKVEIPGEGKQRCRRWFNNRGSSNVLSSESILIISKKKNRYLVSGIIPVNSFQFSIIKPFYLITARKTSKKNIYMKNSSRNLSSGILKDQILKPSWKILPIFVLSVAAKREKTGWTVLCMIRLVSRTATFGDSSKSKADNSEVFRPPEPDMFQLISNNSIAISQVKEKRWMMSLQSNNEQALV